MKARSIRGQVVAVAFGALLGCGTRAASPVDGGGDGAVDTPLTTRRSFDVVATFSAAAGVMTADLPVTDTFTLVLDPASRHVFVGGKGRASTNVYSSADGRTFQVPPFSVGLVTQQACSGATSLDFTTFEVTVSGSTLTGTAEGMAQVSCGDCQFGVKFTARLAGVADVTAPFLIASPVPANPYQPFSVLASEPLPPTATARLVASDGTSIDLAPSVVLGEMPVIDGFTKPDIVLPFSNGYVVALDGLVDFAGLRGSAATPLRLAAFPTPPLVPEDGFEGATGAQVGGAAVITGGPVPPITGARSVYVGPSGAPALGGVAPGAALRVRLAVQPGDTKLRFSYQVVSPSPGSGFAGVIDYGSVGHKGGSDTLAGASDAAAMMLPDGRTIYVTAVATKEIALPADVTSELAVAFETASLSCGAMPAASGTLIDDLRVE